MSSAREVRSLILLFVVSRIVCGTVGNSRPGYSESSQRGDRKHRTSVAIGDSQIFEQQIMSMQGVSLYPPVGLLAALGSDPSPQSSGEAAVFPREWHMACRSQDTTRLFEVAVAE
ncbi:MAG: hypothetical protein FRX49_00474 [Trebouxia sp. A1-2]|nr:MAG: hypothetical protein FRX49_00474 [Trebouxia sp. A1-2]